VTNYANDANAAACYVFAEGAGTSVEDITSNTNTGTFASSGHPAWSSTVPTDYSNYSASFPASTNDYINIGNDASLQLNRSFTIITWFSNGDVSQEGAMISAGSAGWYFRVNASKINFLQSQTANILSGATTLSNNTFYHGVVTVGSGVTADVELFLDGISDGTTTTAITFVNNINSKGIGSENLGAQGVGRGLMTEIAIFSRVLNSTEINDIIDHGIQGGYGAVVVRTSRRMLMGVG
jgi:hypothetical protein